jgi:glycogen operon protein
LPGCSGWKTIPSGYPGDNALVAMKSVVADPDAYDWEDDLPLKRPFVETVIYELHVRGFAHDIYYVLENDKSCYADYSSQLIKCSRAPWFSSAAASNRR